MRPVWLHIVFMVFIFVIPSLGDDFMAHPLDFSTPACDNLHAHVCAMGHGDDYDFDFKETFENALSDDALKHINRMEDPVFDLIVQIVRNKGHLNSNKCGTKGLEGENSLGKALAYGKVDKFAIDCLHSQNKCKFLDKEGGSKGRNVEQKLYKLNCSDVKTAVIDFLDLVDEKGLMKRETLGVNYASGSPDRYQANLANRMKVFESVDASRKHFEIDLHEMLFTNRHFSPYFNLVYSKILKEDDVYVSKEVVKELETLFYMVKDEIMDRVNNSFVVSPNSREKINAHFRSVKPQIGLPYGFNDSTAVDRQIARYREHLANFDVTGECSLELLAREIHLVRNRIILEEDGNLINTLSKRQNYEDSVHEHNAFYTGEVYLLPSYIHIFKKKMSLGMKYGIIVSTIAHELFHGLGLETTRGYLKEVGNTEHYKEAVKCYTQYYDSMCTLSKPIQCPDGKRKRDEGFADVEGTRIAFALLKKVLNSKTGRHKRTGVPYPTYNAVKLSDLKLSSGYNELQWFFIMSVLEDCTLKTDEKQFSAWGNDDHPRPTIRKIAVVMQMTEFTEVFGCKPDQAMYVEELCETFPSKESLLRRLPKKTSSFTAKNRVEGTANIIIKTIKNEGMRNVSAGILLYLSMLLLRA